MRDDEPLRNEGSMRTTALLVLVLVVGCDGSMRIDAGPPPMDAYVEDAGIDAPMPVDAAPFACVTGETHCPSGCVDTKTDNANCGMCDRVCPTGATCVD